MQLMIIGLVVLIGLLIYAIYYYRHSADEGKIPESRDHVKRGSDSAGKVLYFPTDDVEYEKHKRNID